MLTFSRRGGPLLQEKLVRVYTSSERETKYKIKPGVGPKPCLIMFQVRVYAAPRILDAAD